MIVLSHWVLEADSADYGSSSMIDIITRILVLSAGVPQDTVILGPTDSRLSFSVDLPVLSGFRYGRD